MTAPSDAQTLIKPDVYKITLEIESDLPMDQVVFFAQNVGFDTVSQSVFERQSDPETVSHSPYLRIEWLLHATPERQDWVTRILAVSEMMPSNEDGSFKGFSFDIETLNFEKLDDVNWLEESYRQFPPFHVGPFFIYGSHYEDGVSQDDIGLQIDAATAFGSGEHETTSGCLKGLIQLKEQGFNPASLLDLGTGSGILAIGARKLWADAQIVASDIDPESVTVTQKHCAINNVEHGQNTDFEVVLSNGFQHKTIQNHKPYDLIVANILAGPLIEMAHELCSYVHQDGFIILSGILVTQKNEILAVYEAEGCKVQSVNDNGDWTAILLSAT